MSKILRRCLWFHFICWSLPIWKLLACCGSNRPAHMLEPINTVMLPAYLLTVSHATITCVVPYQMKVGSSPIPVTLFAPFMSFMRYTKHNVQLSMTNEVRSLLDPQSKEMDGNPQMLTTGSPMSDGKRNIPLITNFYCHASNANKKQSLTMEITRSEWLLFEVLRDCIAFHSLKLVLRVAGGWVRDKLLKVSSKDIDIALDSMTGVEFCKHLNAFTEQSLGFQKTVGIVKRRPEQSKHLETATLNILGFDIDFVNLRSESYAQDSRIPVMKIGTPMEDAMRRDFTINSLFYNISTNTVEDYTGLGIQDLNAELIRTCSPALGTFLDDPLRVIRAARFSARLGYRLHNDIMVASSHHDVLRQLRNKVARPRIAQELDDILSRGDVARAFELMEGWGVLAVLTRDAKDDTPNDEHIRTGCRLMRLLRESLQCLTWGSINLKIAYLAALCYPVKDEPLKQKCTFIDHVIKSRLRLPNKLAAGANIVVDGSVAFEHAIQELPCDTPSLRQTLGQIVRNIGPLWKEALLLAMAKEVLRHSGATPASFSQKYSDVMKTIYELKIEGAHFMKAPITGEELMTVLPGLSPGPVFKDALDFQITQLLRTPSLTKEELLQRVVERFKNKFKKGI